MSADSLHTAARLDLGAEGGFGDRVEGLGGEVGWRGWVGRLGGGVGLGGWVWAHGLGMPCRVAFARKLWRSTRCTTMGR